MIVKCTGCRVVFDVRVLPLRCACGVTTHDEATEVVKTVQRAGVGAELLKIIPEFFKRKGCGCKSYAARLDRWGVSMCETRFDEIVQHLVAQAKQDRIAKYFGPVSELQAKRWLARAIDQAKGNTIASDRYSAVWVYWSGGAAGEELRYSMRSAEANLTDLANVVLCGDIPDWFQGDAIVSPKWTKAQNKTRFGTRRWAKWIDSIVKLKKIIEDPRVTDRFLWMYDDTFIVRPTSIAGMLEPRASGKISPKERGNTWRIARARTALALINAGLPNWDYSTHCPIVFDKQRLAQTIELFKPDTMPRVIESLYCNHHHTNPRSCRDFFHYRKQPLADWNVPDWAKIINVGGFNLRVREVIEPRFPEPCTSEKDAETTDSVVPANSAVG